MIGAAVARHRRAAAAMDGIVSVVVVAFAVRDAPRLLGGLAIAALVASSLEGLLPLRQARRTPRAWLTDLTYAVGNRTLILPLLAVLLWGIGTVTGHLPTSGLRSAVGAAPVPVRVAILFVSSDLANYATHRLLHRVGWLWRFHAVHHSSERVDWLATSRGHPLDQAVNIAGASLPLYFLGGAGYAPLLITFLYLYPFVLHAAARIRLGPLDRVLVTPEFHHWHHALDAEAHHRNFGAILSIWDHLFGTASESIGHPDSYGVEGLPLDNRTYIEQLLSPFTPA